MYSTNLSTFLVLLFFIGNVYELLKFICIKISTFFL